MYSGFEIAEMGKNLKFDYTPEVIKLIVDSTKLTKEEKEQTLNKVLTSVKSTGKMFSKSNYLYLKSKLYFNRRLTNYITTYLRRIDSYSVLQYYPPMWVDSTILCRYIGKILYGLSRCRRRDSDYCSLWWRLG